MMPRSWGVGNQRLRESRIRTLREQCVWAELDGTVDQLPPAVSGFVDRYTSWLIQRHRHLTRHSADNRFIGADASASEGYQASQ